MGLEFLFSSFDSYDPALSYCWGSRLFSDDLPSSLVLFSDPLRASVTNASELLRELTPIERFFSEWALSCLSRFDRPDPREEVVNLELLPLLPLLPLLTLMPLLLFLLLALFPGSVGFFVSWTSFCSFYFSFTRLALTTSNGIVLKYSVSSLMNSSSINIFLLRSTWYSNWRPPALSFH